MNQSENIVSELKKIINQKDAAAVEEKAFQLIQENPRNNEILELLCLIFESNWHTRHEDMARSFQEIKNPIAINALFKVANIEFEYNAWNNNYPLQRKCTWALADIGTELAYEKLKLIAQNQNKTIAAFAQKRIDNWESEQARKGQ